MPKLLAYLPCEKVVVEEESKNISVLSILETVNVTLPKGGAAPAQPASMGMAWATSRCGRRKRESRASSSRPSSALGSTTRQQIIHRMASFPIWMPGACQLKLMVKTSREPDFRELANVIVVLRHAWA
jgi:hypothetical protein